MTTARKTVARSALVEQLNTALASPGLTVDQRVTLAAFVDGVLVNAKAYAGFNYQHSEFDDGELRDGYDDSRRRYF